MVNIKIKHENHGQWGNLQYKKDGSSILKNICMTSKAFFISAENKRQNFYKYILS